MTTLLQSSPSFGPRAGGLHRPDLPGFRPGPEPRTSPPSRRGRDQNSFDRSPFLEQETPSPFPRGRRSSGSMFCGGSAARGSRPGRRGSSHRGGGPAALRPRVESRRTGREIQSPSFYRSGQRRIPSSPRPRRRWSLRGPRPPPRYLFCPDRLSSIFLPVFTWKASPKGPDPGGSPRSPGRRGRSRLSASRSGLFSARPRARSGAWLHEPSSPTRACRPG